MTTKDLMQRLGLGYRSATELMRSSGFPSIQVGKKFVVDEQAYEKWYRLNQGRQVIRQPGISLLISNPQEDHPPCSTH